MKLVRTLLLACAVASPVLAQDPKQDALRDLQVGMQGLKQAANDPELLATLMRDLAVRVADDSSTTYYDPSLTHSLTPYRPHHRTPK